MSRRNATFWSKVGETGVSEMGVGEQGLILFTFKEKNIAYACKSV